MPSTLGFALLGLLARKPRTGYELVQSLRRPIGYFWTASHSQVYPELAHLETERLVRHRVVDGPGPRDTKRYSITGDGRRELARWTVTPAPPEPSRNEFLLRVYSLWLADSDAARALIARERDQHHDLLAHYERIAEEMERGEPIDPGTALFYEYATLRRGLSFELHVIAWCDWLLDALSDAAAQR